MKRGFLLKQSNIGMKKISPLLGDFFNYRSLAAAERIFKAVRSIFVITEMMLDAAYFILIVKNHKIDSFFSFRMVKESQMIVAINAVVY